MIQRMLVIWSLVPLSSKSSLNIWKFMVHVLLKPGLKNFEHYFASVWDECNCAVFEHSLGLEWKHVFQSCGHCWVFQICWHIEHSTFTALSFRIWNSSTGIPSPPLALFLVMHFGSPKWILPLNFAPLIVPFSWIWAGLPLALVLRIHPRPMLFACVLVAQSCLTPCAVCVCVLVSLLCLTLCDSMDCSWPGSSVHGILQARILEWVAIPFSRDRLHPGIELGSPVLLSDSLPTVCLKKK